jgi:hypothetical protein
MINPEQYFYVSDGSVLKDLNDFHEKMKSISDETFNNHVNSEKNDFYNWTKEVLKDGKLANAIKKAGSSKSILEAIEKRIKSIEKSNKKKETKKSMVRKIKEVHDA